MTGKIMPLRERTPARSRRWPTPSCPRRGTPTQYPLRLCHVGVLDRLLVGLGASRPLAEVSGEELVSLLDRLWGQRTPGDLEPQPRRCHRQPP